MTKVLNQQNFIMVFLKLIELNKQNGKKDKEKGKKEEKEEKLLYTNKNV